MSTSGLNSSSQLFAKSGKREQMMEMNTKTPFLWDWDNLAVYPAARAADVPNRLQLADSEFEPIEGFEISTFNSSAGDSASDLGYGSSSKSTKSVSVDSSSIKEIRDSKFKLGPSDFDFSQDLSNRKPASIGSGDSLIGLKLGKRTYFEDVPESSYVTRKRLKLSTQTTEIPRCQVEGCNLDLSSAKDYHRKHRVCESHAKNPKVVICGAERRFCQQCSRFHSLSEFDQKKRSCRRRLSDHNARRRKPKPEIIQFSSMRLPSSLHEGRNQISLAFNQVPMIQTRPNSNATWDFTSSSKLTHEKHGLFSPKKFGGIDTPHVSPQNESRETGFKLSYDSPQLMSSNGATADVFHQCFQVSSTINDINSGPELRALSLLSTNSWGSCSQEPTDHQSSLIQHHHRTPLHHMPPVSAEHWPGQQQPTPSSSSSQFPTLQKNGTTNPCQEFQSFKPPNENNGIYLYEGPR